MKAGHGDQREPGFSGLPLVGRLTLHADINKHGRTSSVESPLYGLKRLLQLVGVAAYGIRHAGRENIPASGGVLMVSNHQSHLDPPFVGMGVARRMNYLARDTLFHFAPFRWLIHSVDAIPIDREGIGLTGIKESLRRLKRGEMVLIFPEGTRSRDGEIAPFKPGFTVLASRSGASILPVAIDGAYEPGREARSSPALASSASAMAGRCCRKRSRAATSGSWRRKWSGASMNVKRRFRRALPGAARGRSKFCGRRRAQRANARTGPGGRLGPADVWVGRRSRHGSWLTVAGKELGFVRQGEELLANSVDQEAEIAVGEIIVQSRRRDHVADQAANIGSWSRNR